MILWIVKHFLSARIKGKISLFFFRFVFSSLCVSLTLEGRNAQSLCFPIDAISFSSLASSLYPTSNAELDDAQDNAERKLIASHFPFIKTIIKPYLHQCLNAQHIAILLQSLNQSALKEGYVTTRFGIAEQDLRSGILEIHAQLGKIGKIEYQHNGTMLFFQKDFDIKQGDIRNLKKLEQGIANLTRIKSLDTTMQILPAYSEDMSDIYDCS